MLNQYSSTKDKKLLVEAEELLQDSKAKIEYLKMKILKTKQSSHSNSGDTNTNNCDNPNNEMSTPAEERIEELRHHLRIESACLEGAKNVLKILSANKNVDKKAHTEAHQNCIESSQKLDLIRHGLELLRQELPVGSHKSQELKSEIDSTVTMSPGSFSHLSDNRFSGDMSGSGGNQPSKASAVFNRTAAVTGKLEVRLMGCQVSLSREGNRILGLERLIYIKPNYLRIYEYFSSKAVCQFLLLTYTLNESNFIMVDI